MFNTLKISGASTSFQSQQQPTQAPQYIVWQPQPMAINYTTANQGLTFINNQSNNVGCSTLFLPSSQIGCVPSDQVITIGCDNSRVQSGSCQPINFSFQNIIQIGTSAPQIQNPVISYAPTSHISNNQSYKQQTQNQAQNSGSFAQNSNILQEEGQNLQIHHSLNNPQNQFINVMESCQCHSLNQGQDFHIVNRGHENEVQTPPLYKSQNQNVQSCHKQSGLINDNNNVYPIASPAEENMRYNIYRRQINNIQRFSSRNSLNSCPKFTLREVIVDGCKVYKEKQYNPLTKRKNTISYCGKCDKPFTKTCNLRDHLRIHTGLKPYICNQCNKDFTQKGQLTKHEKIHKSNKSKGSSLNFENFQESGPDYNNDLQNESRQLSISTSQRSSSTDFTNSKVSSLQLQALDQKQEKFNEPDLNTLYQLPKFNTILQMMQFNINHDNGDHVIRKESQATLQKQNCEQKEHLTTQKEILTNFILNQHFNVKKYQTKVDFMSATDTMTKRLGLRENIMMLPFPSPQN